MSPPKRRYRILLPDEARLLVSGSWSSTQYFDTEKQRNDEAHRIAREHKVDIACESWAEEHSQDDLNQGWAVDYVAHHGAPPPPQPGRRTIARKLVAGDTAVIFGFRTDGREEPGQEHEGVVEQVTARSHFLDTEIRFTDGRSILCRNYAVARVLVEAAERGDPND